MLSSKQKILIFLMFFGTMVLSLIFGENSSGGAKIDYLLTQKYIESFQVDLNKGIELFKKDNQGHLPFFYLLIANLNSFFGEKFVNYFYLVISSCIPIVFYNILKKNFSKNSNDILFFLSLIIFLSPYFRSSAIWITTDNLALLFFLLSINSFLNTRNSQIYYLRNSFFCFLYLILASYVRQNYALFFVFYFLSIQSNLKFKDNLFILAFNFFLSIPALIWIFFVFEIESIQTGYYWTSDFLFNVLIFCSLFFFYFLPFVFNKYAFQFIKSEIIKKKTLLYILALLTLSLFIFYEIPEIAHGGGVFYKISKIIDLNFIFIFSFLGLVSLFIFNDLVKINYLIYLTLIFSYPFMYLYQKYYDPLVFILILTLIDSKFIKELIENKNLNIYFIFTYFILFLIGSNLYYMQF